MEYWQLWCLVIIIFFIVEMFTPVNFFLNLGLACLISALVAYLGGNLTIQSEPGKGTVIEAKCPKVAYGVNRI